MADSVREAGSAVPESSAGPSAASIEITDLGVRFGDVIAVADLSLTIAENELVVLLGGSGSGKTTTLKTINRLVEPTSGSVKLAGTDVRALIPHELRRRVGYCFQGIGLFPHMTVAENVGVTPRLLGWPAARVRARIDALLAMVELDPDAYRGRMPSTLSGGQQQRVGVARALAAEPEVVLFDEPFGALDALIREQLQTALVHLREEMPFAGVFVTHDVLEAFRLADRIAVMRDGRLLQVDTPDALAAKPVDAYVAELLDAPRRAAERLATRTPTTDAERAGS